MTVERSSLPAANGTMAVERACEFMQDAAPLWEGMGMAFGVAAKGIRGSLLWLVAFLGFLIAPLGPGRIAGAQL